MCGIAGWLQPKPVWNAAHLQAMARAIAHRGPDAEGFWTDPEDPRIALAHRRLSILDLSEAANQPLLSACERFVLVYNGEIYNAEDLAKQWKINRTTRSDSEVLIEGLAKFGSDILPELNGMFAFACWDRREKTLLMARDPFGIKPLLYTLHQSAIAFASELKALLALPLERKLNLQGLQDYLFLEYSGGPDTMLQGFHRLEPGTSVRWKAGILQTQRFRNLNDWSTADRLNPRTATAEAPERFAAAVNRHLLSDVPVGCFLSGGIDSSLVAAVAHGSLADMPAFTLGFEVPEYDETAAASAVARHLGLSAHHRKTLTEADALAEIEGLAGKVDEPFAVPSVLPTAAVSALAAQQLKVTLSGDGGDELFMGYGYYNWYERMQKLSRWGGRIGRQAAGMLLRFGGEREQRASRLFSGPDPLRGVDWPHIWSQEQHQFTEAEIARLLGHSYRNQWLRQEWEALSALPLSPFERIALLDLKTYLPYDLMYKMDISSMQHGLEVRVPMLDHEWAAFALRLPLSLRRTPANSKVLLKSMLERHLPPELIYRRKWGFPAPMGHWLEGPLSYLIDRYLNEKTLRRQDVFVPAEVSRWVAAFRASGGHYHYKRVWSLLFFQLWWKHWMDDGL